MTGGGAEGRSLYSSCGVGREAKKRRREKYNKNRRNTNGLQNVRIITGA
jgi:hypothetical protein